MSSRFRLTMLLIVSLCGCGTKALPPENAVTTTAARAKELRPKLADQAQSKADNNTEKSEKQKASAEKSVVALPPAPAFDPPYPNRENLFLAPKRSSTHAKTPGSVEQTVELLGFVNVEKQKVILSINGDVFPICEGEQQAGIEVISIQPPAVVLQRDRERWQATLEN
jgi:predicted small lipoprotein YifL